ncbi:pirin family protein [Aestuariibacter salexigens]|uniref:pirin family protein n=1 Tax=Aestuariibacter salexigens TaxID=226010 RepID=UPI0003FA479D|nr:pirin family protein [Aestuariibacter salexigens]
MTERRVNRMVQGLPTQDGAGVKLKRILGQPALQNLDPFLMLDEFHSDQADDYIKGFPPHPHRGFQTVTYMLNGKMRHRDSVGNEGIIDDGGLQWMNAGRGIIHEEMPQQSEGLMRGFQLWVNLPASEKMSAPGYEDIPGSQVPVVNNEVGQVRVLAGSYADVEGPVKSHATEPLFLDVTIEGGELSVPIAAGHSAFVYCFDGQLAIGQSTFATGTLAVLSDGGQVTLSGKPSGRAIIVAGQPINEPIVQYGPFVMNTEQEIHQAIQDFQQGRLA